MTDYREIVIKIPEELYKECLIVHLPSRGYGRSITSNLLSAVKEGTPLPKGHGDLKDVNNLKRAFSTWSAAVQGNFNDADIASIVYKSPTILEADKDGEE